MARAPRRTPAPGMFEPQTDPLDEAVIVDQEGIAGDLTEILEKLQGYDSSSIKGVLFQKPKNGVGRFEWIEEVSPPFDMSGIMQELKERFGGGDFRLSIFAGGKVRKQIEFSIVREKTSLIAPPKNDGGENMMAMVQLMMSQQVESARDSRASADRQMQLMMNSSNQSMQMMVAMMSAMSASAGKPTDMIPLIAAMKEGSSSGGMKEMVETLVALKSITEPATSSGFDADNIVGSVLKIAGPVAGAVGRAVGNMRPRGAVPVTDEAQHFESNPDQLMLPQAQMQLPSPSPVPSQPPSDNGVARLLALIRPDVNYFFQRQHDTDLAADAVYRVIEAALDAGTLAEDDLNDMVTAYMVSPNWLVELAAAGIDLRSRPEWAQSFLADLVTLHVDAGADSLGNQNDDDPEREGGSLGDAGADGQAVAARVKGDEGSSTGGKPDDAGI